MSEKAGRVEYEIRGDDSKIEADLSQANKKVEKAAKESADKTVKIEKDKSGQIKKSTDQVVQHTQRASDDVASAWQDAGKDAKKAMENISDQDIDIQVEADTRSASAEVSKISKDRSIDVDVDAETSAAKSEIKELGDVGEQVASEIEGSFKDAFGNIGSTAKDSFSEAVTGAIPFGDKIGDLTKGLSGTQAMAMGFGGAFFAAGVKGVSVAGELDSAINQFASSTGKSKEEAEKYQDVFEDIYANNYGEDFNDIAEGVSNVTKNMGEMDDEQLQNVTESAFAMRDTFGYDIPESTKAAKAMMEQFGISGEEAMNLIAAGSQNNLDFSGELLDTISEYSVHFERLGMDADDMFKIFQKGADSGAFNLDKVGDAMKEFSNKVLDGSDTTASGFGRIGLDAEEMSKKFAQGGDSAKEAFDQTISALADMEDPLEQNQAGVELFGTMWEDLGADAVTALAEIEEGSYDTGNELEKLKDIKYDDLGSMFETLGRAVEMVLLPLGEALMPLLMTLIEIVLPIITELLTPLIELISAFIEPILMVISEALQPLMDAFIWLMDEVLAPLIELLQEVLMPVFELVMDTISDIISDYIGLMIENFKDLIGFIKDVFTGDWEGAWEHVKNIFKRIIPGFEDVIKGIKRIFGGITDFVKGIFTGNWRQAWNGVKNIFGGVWQAMKGLFKSPINWIIDKLNSFIGGLNKIKLPDWMGPLGGKGINIPKIPRLKVGMDYVPADDFPALLHVGEMVLTKEDAQRLRAIGGMEGLEQIMALEGKRADLAPRLFDMTRVKQTDVKQYVFTSKLDLDGREIARATSTYTDEELARIESLSRRGV
jgi:phage-related minor tail protein